MSRLKTPFRYDYVGSFLRPEELISMRKDFEDRKITAEELKAAEDRCIADLVTKQKAAGYHVITDGEFRRKSWHLDFMWGLNGVERIELDHGYFFHGMETYHTSVEVTGKITGESHPFVDHYKFLRQFEDENTVAKQTIPAPAQMLSELFRADNAEKTRGVYPDYEQLVQDIAAAYRTVIRELYEAGCRNIQLDDCTWGMVVDSEYWEKKLGAGADIEEEARKYLRINNLAIEGKPEDLVINTHVCRGNYQSTYAASGPYDKIAPILFSDENAEAFYLEYDDERSGGFEPLKYVTGNKKVVLGLITTKSPVLEKKEEVIARIHEAEKYIPLDRLYLSPQCGFSSNEIGNKLTEEEQWAKLALVRQIAEEVWGKESV
ncbi:MAG: 5-methyltetrahydropteroyltriglutamate--homocysteine S-methyltransferase [Anaerovoracaceae bacterium]